MATKICKDTAERVCEESLRPRLDWAVPSTFTSGGETSPKAVALGVALRRIANTETAAWTVSALLLIGCTADPSPSTVEAGAITSVTVHPSSLRRFDNDSDIWPITWADDGNLYAAGGDGEGWDGIDTRGLDVTRLSISAPLDDLRFGGTEIYSKTGVLPKGLLSVSGVLYLLEQERGNGFSRARIGWSEDHGRSWTYNGDGRIDWDLDEYFAARAHFVNFGRDYSEARDEYVYLVGSEAVGGGGRPGELDGQVVLFRSPVDGIASPEEYEYFSGTQESPAWSSSPDARRPILLRPGEVHWGATINYNPVLERYLLSFFIDNRGTLAVYDGPEPWGPWVKIHEERLVDSREKYSLFFVSKPGWLSNDGLTWWFVTSGELQWDAFNLLEAILTVSSPGQAVD